MADGSNQTSIRFVTRKWTPAMGGMETYCHRLTQELAKRHSVEVIALPGNNDGSPPGAISLLMFGISTASKMHWRRPTDICHLGDMAIWPLAWISRLRHRRTKYVISVHGTDVSYPLRGGLLGGLYGRYLKLGARLMPDVVVIANSRATAEACALYGYRDVKIVSLATDMQRTDPEMTPSRHLLFAGRLVRRKGLAWFTENVLPMLPATIGLKVAGTVWDKSEGEALSNPRIEYVGNLPGDALARAYATALCVVIPNVDVESREFEGFGLVAVEAAAAGGIVVASFHSGLKEALINGVTGFHVPAGDAQKWSEKIDEIAAWDKSTRDKFLAKSAAAVDAHYRWDRVARETELLY